MLLWLVQMNPKVNDKQANLSKILKHLDKAGEENADIIVFPELSLTGYECEENFKNLAEPIPGPSVNKVIEKAKEYDYYVTFGMAERENGYLYISSPFVGPEGHIGTARKIYLENFKSLKTGISYDMKKYFTPGNEMPVFDTKFGKVGVEICYDAFFPEITRKQAIEGAWLLLNTMSGPKGVAETHEIVGKVRAYENLAYVAKANTVGRQKEMEFDGGSFVIGPDMETKVQASSLTHGDAQEEVIKYEFKENIEDEMMKLRMGGPIVRDCRPEIYEKVTETMKKTFWED